MIEVYMTVNEPQTIRDEYPRVTNILDADNNQTSARLDDVISQETIST
jgi:hypothetical protein